MKKSHSLPIARSAALGLTLVAALAPLGHAQDAQQAQALEPEFKPPVVANTISGSESIQSRINAWLRKTTDPLFLMRHSMGFGGCMRLNDVLTANGFEPKSGSGLQAVQFWHEGNRAALSAYCMDDARLTYELCETRTAIVWGPQWRLHLWEPRVLRFVGGD